MNAVVGRIAAASIAAGLALACAACGGSGSSSSSPAATTTTTAVASTTPAADLANGRALFPSTCGGCHVLKAAGTVGTVGPNLDKSNHSLAFVVDRVTNGNTNNLGVMPAFVGSLTAQQIHDISAYVAQNAGK
jgi:mono/diheme cytochrome c family protein